MTVEGHWYAVDKHPCITFHYDANGVPLDRACACVSLPGNCDAMYKGPLGGSNHLAAMASCVSEANYIFHDFPKNVARTAVLSPATERKRTPARFIDQRSSAKRYTRMRILSWPSSPPPHNFFALLPGPLVAKYLLWDSVHPP